MKTGTITRIATEYGLDATSVAAPQKGYRNESYRITLTDKTAVNLILYKVEPDILTKITNAHAVANSLQDLTVRKPISKRIITLQTSTSKQYGALYNYLPGSTIPWEAYTSRHIKLLGMVHGKMHAELKHIELDLPDVTEEYLTINSRMATYFSDPNVMRAMQDKLHLQINNKIFLHNQQILGVISRLQNQQPLHMDFVRGNILFDESDELTISGILDFEKVAWGHPIMDIARTYAFLLVDCKYKTNEQVHKYYLLSGYRKRGNPELKFITHKDIDLLEELVNIFLLYDFYKFLLHNPYEYLHQNEHFVRTRELLTTRGLLMLN